MRILNLIDFILNNNKRGDNIILLFSGLIYTLIVLQSCNNEAHDITIVQKTALEYAYECEDVLGKLPNFKYEDALEIPMTKNGIPITQATNNSNDCDNPFAFGAACDPGNRLGRYQGINPDGSENDDVVFITFFRDGGLGVIGHKFSTGETCFLETVGKFDAANNPIPIPGDANYNEIWAKPSKLVSEFNCVNCHMASPYIHTPAIDQLKNPSDTSELLVPLTGNNPYIIIGQEFGEPLTTNIINSCTSCHRPQCTQHFENFPLDELVMPPPFKNATDFDHSNISNQDREAIRNWCNSLTLSPY